MDRVWRGATYAIEVRNPRHVSRGVTRLAVDGEPQDPSVPIAPRPAGARVRVVATLG